MDPVPLFPSPTLWERIRKNKMLLFGLGIFSVIFLGALILPWFYPYHEHMSLNHTLTPPNLRFPFGTDLLGRCMLSRTLQGLRLSLLIALIATFLDVFIGLLWSTIAIFSHRNVNFLMMRTTEILYSLPNVPVIILLLVIFHNGILPLILSMIMTGWIPISRIIYGQFLLLQNKGFVLSAKAMNASVFHILMKHLIPNSLAPIISTLIFTIPKAIYTEAFISFLGLGIQPPRASLGTLVKEGINAVDYYPWLFFFPSICIVSLSISFNLIGQGAKRLFIEENFHE